MVHTEKEEGMIEMLIERFERQQLERVLKIKAAVDRGEKLNDFDREFLEEVCREAMENRSLVDKFPEYQALFARVVHLYREITEKALENEQRG